MARDERWRMLGRVRLDRETMKLASKDGAEVSLRPQSAELLRVLVDREGELLTKDELIEAVWRDINVTDDSLTQCVADIRRAIGDSSRSILQTVPKRGYRLVLPPPAILDENEGARPATRRWRLATAAAVIAVGVGLAAFLSLGGGNPSEAAANREMSLADMQTPVRALPSIRVRPFEDLSGDPGWHRIGIGLGAEIAASLSRTRDLRVVGAENHGTAVPDVNTRYVVAGTLLSDGGQVRATARLTETASDRIIWSGAWVMPDDETTGLIDAVVGQVLSGVGDRLSGAISKVEAEAARRRLPASLGALDWFVLGLEEKNRYFLDPDDPAPLHAATDYLTRAIETDAEFAAAYDVLAWVQSFLGDMADTPEQSEALFSASAENVHRAVRLDPGDAIIIGHLAFIRTLEGDYDGAWQDALKAATLAPNTADALAMAAVNYPFADHTVDGVSLPLQWAERALELNPSPPAWYHAALANAAFYAGDTATARREAMKDLRTFNMLIYAAAAALDGDQMEAEAMLEKYRSASPFETAEAFFFLDISKLPQFKLLVEGLRKAGLPITNAEAEKLELVASDQ